MAAISENPIISSLEKDLTRLNSHIDMYENEILNCHLIIYNVNRRLLYDVRNEKNPINRLRYLNTIAHSLINHLETKFTYIILANYPITYYLDFVFLITILFGIFVSYLASSHLGFTVSSAIFGYYFTVIIYKCMFRQPTELLKYTYLRLTSISLCISRNIANYYLLLDYYNNFLVDKDKQMRFE